MRKVKKTTWIVILCVSVAALLAAGFFLFRYVFQEDIGREALIPVSETPGDGTVPADETQAPAVIEPVQAFGYETAKTENVSVSFDELMTINPDIYAWIYIPNTNVDYPVAQSAAGDDYFYLEHNIYGQYQFSGTIYSEVQNSTDFHDRVTVLYGHNMLNGSMFASLHYFEDPAFFEENNTIIVLTKDKTLTYLIYAAYTYDDRHILNSFFFSDDEVFREYLDSTLSPHSVDGNVREGVELSLDSRILTLSTCANDFASNRYLVQGVLVDERERS